MTAFVERIKALAEKANRIAGQLETEEATKTALVMPFVAALGYDVFDPLEVIPELTADVGMKKGEKVDYAIKVNGEIAILIEAKHAATDLSTVHASQLFRYFTVTKARIALLTNGIVYRFFSDLDEPNKMDVRPFLEIDLFNLRTELVTELRKMSKESFDLEKMLTAAASLRDLDAIQHTLEQQLEEPHEEFVRFFFTRACPTGRFSQANREYFTGLVKIGLTQFIGARVEARLRSALQQQEAQRPQPQVNAPANGEGPGEDVGGIVTTEEEIEGYRIVKAIVCTEATPDRIIGRDQKNFFSVLLDDTNRKPICRLYFNREPKTIGLIDSEKTERREVLASLEDIYRFAAELRETTRRYVDDPASQVTNPKP